MTDTCGPPDHADRLRALGLRATPQRRAILAAFDSLEPEHLSADEVYSRASSALAGLSRGTVYTTLGEFTEHGLLAAVAALQPMRYETDTRTHAHLRCKLCQRLFNIFEPTPESAPYEKDGHEVDAIHVLAEGTCAGCRQFDAGLRVGASVRIETSSELWVGAEDTATVEIDTPLGTLLVTAVSGGITRIAFSQHRDAPILRERIGQGGATARDNATVAASRLRDYLTGQAPVGDPPSLAIDLPTNEMAALDAVLAVPPGSQRSYHLIDSGLTPYELGRLLGANPLPLLYPCHRILCGTHVPATFVGGSDSREWLLDLDAQGASAAGRALPT